MVALTGGSAEIEDDTKLKINAGEILTKDGVRIKSRVAKVGVGFGTARHSDRRHRLRSGDTSPEIGEV